MTPQQLKRIKSHITRLMQTHSRPMHDLDHLKRVDQNSHNIAARLPRKNIDLNLLSAICYLHDISVLSRLPGYMIFFFESSIASYHLNKTLPSFNLSPHEISLIITAIKHHPHSFPFRRLNRHRHIYAQILQDADLIDQFSPQRIQALKNSPPSIRKSLALALAKPTLHHVQHNLDKYLNLKQSIPLYYAQNQSISI